MENEKMKLNFDSMSKVAGGGGVGDAVSMCKEKGHKWELQLTYYNRDLTHEFRRYECTRCGAATKYEVTDTKTGETRDCTDEETQYGDPMW